MRRIVFLLCSLLLILSASSALADDQSISCSPLIFQETLTPLGTSTTVEHTQPCVVHVKLVHTQQDGSTVETVISPTAFDITYKFRLYKRSGALSGGELLGNTWPKVEATDYNTYDLDISVERIARPENVTVSVSGNNYSFQVMGGAFTVTYNSVIYFDANGVQTGVEPTTQTRAFYVQVEGTVK